MKKLSFNSVIIFFGGLLLFLIGINGQEIIGFEARFYLFALEMYRHGVSLFPETYHQPYPDYPVSSTLLIYGLAKLLGHLSKLVAVMPSAIAASATLVVTYWIGLLHDKRWGLFAVFFLLLTNTFVMEARTISPDQYIVLVTTLSFYLIYSADRLHEVKRVWFVPLLFLVGFAFRGPIGLIVPAGVVCGYYFLDKNFKAFFLFGLLAFLSLLLASAILFGAAYEAGGVLFMQDVFRLQVSGRLQEADLPWYFYFSESIGAYAIAYPLAFLVVVGLVREFFIKNSSADIKFIQKLAGWALIIIIGLTIPAGKKIRYIMAFAPALALISAYLFVMPAVRANYFNWLRRVVYYVCYFLPAMCQILLICAMYYAPPLLISSISFATVSCCYFLLQFLNLNKDELVVIGVAAVTFVLTIVLIVEPINLALNRTQSFVDGVEAARVEQHAQLVFYHQAPDGMPIKYLVNAQSDEIPVFISTLDEMIKFKGKAFIVASEEDYVVIIKAGKLFKILYKGSLGHEPVVVLKQE